MSFMARWADNKLTSLHTQLHRIPYSMTSSKTRQEIYKIYIVTCKNCRPAQQNPLFNDIPQANSRNVKYIYITIFKICQGRVGATIEFYFWSLLTLPDYEFYAYKDNNYGRCFITPLQLEQQLVTFMTENFSENSYFRLFYFRTKHLFPKIKPVRK